MKKSVVLAMSALVMLTSCETYTGAGTYMGASLGSILGSAIGGIAGGPYGSDVGTIVGMAGGAIVGAKMGADADQRRADDMDRYRRDRMERMGPRPRMDRVPHACDEGRQGVCGASPRGYSDGMGSALPGDTLVVPADSAYGSGFDSTNSGDDRLYDFDGTDYTGNYSAQQPMTTMPMQSGVERLASGMKYNADIEVRNARFVDENQDGKLQRGELCKIIFEVINRGAKPLADVVPTVVETTGNRHIYISPNMHVEKIMPGKGIRYTALVKADNRLKKGTARFCVSAVQDEVYISKVSEFRIPCVR